MILNFLILTRVLVETSGVLHRVNKVALADNDDEG